MHGSLSQCRKEDMVNRAFVRRSSDHPGRPGIMRNRESGGELLIEADRARILAAALYALPAKVLKELEECLPAAAEAAPGGVSWICFGHELIVLLPRLDTRQQCEAAAAGLMTVRRSISQQPLNWILDFSAVRRIGSHEMLVLIEAIDSELRAGGLRLTVTWLPCRSVPDEFCRSLALIGVGEYLFSPVDVS